MGMRRVMLASLAAARLCGDDHPVSVAVVAFDILAIVALMVWLGVQYAVG